MERLRSHIAASQRCAPDPGEGRRDAASWTVTLVPSEDVLRLLRPTPEAGGPAGPADALLLTAWGSESDEELARARATSSRELDTIVDAVEAAHAGVEGSPAKQALAQHVLDCATAWLSAVAQEHDAIVENKARVLRHFGRPPADLRYVLATGEITKLRLLAAPLLLALERLRAVARASRMSDVRALLRGASSPAGAALAPGEGGGAGVPQEAPTDSQASDASSELGARDWLRRMRP